ncbi:hypothetical protein C461_04357 [Halorubrum aidingense JCM 13560]|uniref:Uncharacterized protein n=1 Tax=Halorubrum aidingense JCM 13560 TaxID=1230454 RepID=M0PFE2_9EURY|nr:hypothetical protein [Halorubrum aidingense]EMA68832.1 hypothetical protein C461_04357 [Halorubrum aidingense JCM 13560]
MQSLPASELRDQFNTIPDLLEADENFVEADGLEDRIIRLTEYSFEEMVELGRSLNVNTFYGTLKTADDGTPQWAQMFFLYDGVGHVQTIESAELAQVREHEADEQSEELEQKRDLADEILEQYAEFLDDATEYRLNNNVGEVTIERLFRLQDRLQEEKEEQRREERIDEELEMELAEAVYNDDRYHSRFNTTDVEMLLEQLDVEFDEDKVRINRIDTKAKSLLKLEE